MSDGREDRMVWRGDMALFMMDETRLIDLEGAFRSSKTTACLRKVAKSCQRHPGICWWINRYGDGDTQRQLKPQWRAMLSRMGITAQWDPGEQCDVLANGSKVYVFGVKAQDEMSRYSKIRGLTLSGIYNDQTEELPHDIFQEFNGRLSQAGFPHQLLLSPNPPDENHWLCQEFPEDQHLLGRRYYSIPIYANAHNLPAETITALEAAYPPSHPKHRSAILGRRGLNVIGKPVYGGDPGKGQAAMFTRALHVRPLEMDPHLPLYEAIDFGKHHPCCVWAQFSPWGQLRVLGGLMGQNMYLEDFAPLLLQYRAQWFPGRMEEQTCCDPAGSHDNSQGVRNNGLQVLEDLGIHPRYKPNSNAPDVRLAMVERLAGYMRRRTPQGEAFNVESRPERWLLISPDMAKSWPFLADGLEAGYVWDEHLVSVGNKQVRKPKKDGWYEHGQNCLEYLELNFGGQQPSVRQSEQMASRLHGAALRRAQQDTAEPFRWQQGGPRHLHSRGGY